MNTILNNPPSFLNAEDFSIPQQRDFINNPETLDIFADLNWMESNNNNNEEPQIQTQPPENPPPQQINQPSIPPVSSMSSPDSLKKDIIKYLYNNGSCAYLQSCFSKLEDIDSVNDQLLYKKFKIGLVIDSVLGKNSSDKIWLIMCLHFLKYY